MTNPPGLPWQDVIGKTRWEIVGRDPTTDEFWRQHKADLDAHREFRNFRISITLPSGAPLHISVSGKPVFGADGKFQGYRGTITDQTSTIEATRRAEQAERMLRDAIESIPGAIIICDPADRIALTNEYVRERFPECAALFRDNCTFGEFMRSAVRDGTYPDAIGDEEAWLAGRMEIHRAAAGATEFRQKDGHWVLATERRMSDGGVALIGVDVTPLKSAQAALLASQERLDRAQEIAGIGSWEADVETGEAIWSKEMFRIRGLSHDLSPQAAASLQKDIDPEDQPRVAEWFRALEAGHERAPTECRIHRPDGETRIVSLEARPILDTSGHLTRIAGTLRDITEHRATERQLVQAQKMEAIGNLTGGMAHDFNNLLGVIIGNTDLLREGLKGQRELSELATDVLDAALRGAELTARLLAFARRQPLRPERVEVNKLVSDITKLLQRTLGEQIEIKLNLLPQLWWTQVDPSQLESAITNLATNARDAMHKGGRAHHRDAERPSRHRLRQRPFRYQARRLRHGRGERHRLRNTARDRRPHLRAVLHHQGAREGNRARAEHGLRLHPPVGRAYQCL